MSKTKDHAGLVDQTDTVEQRDFIEATSLVLLGRSTLAFPEKFRRTKNFRGKAFVHRTIERRLLKDFTLRVIGRQRDVNF
jgi:hypothetical protein